MDRQPAISWSHTTDNLTPKQTAQLLNIPEATLSVWRCTNRAHFSDRGHPFHADRGHRFTLMADCVQRVRVPGFIVSQVSAMSVKPTELSTPARSAGVGNSAPKAMLG